MTIKAQNFLSELQPTLKTALGRSNVHSLPRVIKVCLNVGLSKGLKDAKYIDAALSTLTRISGQKPVKTVAKKSISNFKIRQGMVVGMKVTLRGKRMNDFLLKLTKITLPRIRDFQGISRSNVDANGNLAIGFREALCFPEIRSDEVELAHGLEVNIVSTATSREEGLVLFQALGIPFKK